MVSREFIHAHLQDQVNNLALHRSQYKDLSDEDWQFFLQQIEGYQRTADKLPLFGEMAKRRDGKEWWFPPRISCEQCSSEFTAKYKATLVSGHHLIDLTGGAGVDTYFLSEQFDTVDYVEQNPDLCRLAEHNLPQKVAIHNCSAEHYLSTFHFQLSTTIYVDPSRRDKNGSKVFRLSDCTPNVVELLPKMRQLATTILIKLSPMLDITEALRELDGEWQVHIVSVKNEVKEVLLFSTSPWQPISAANKITAVDLSENWKFEFTREQEEQAISKMLPLQGKLTEGAIIYEPAAAILKAGAYKLIGARYGLKKLGANTHLYVSDKLVENFPGRCWRILGEVNKGQNGEKAKGLTDEQANVLTRNYPLSADQLKKKLHVKDGGDLYIIGTRIANKPILLFANRL